MKIQEKVDTESVAMTLKALYVKDNEDEDAQIDIDDSDDIDDIMEHIKNIRIQKAKQKLEEETKF